MRSCAPTIPCRVSRAGALIVVTTRDYDSLVVDRPDSTPVQRSSRAGLRTVTTQLWDRHDDSSLYDLTHLQVRLTVPGRWAAASRTATCRAWTRGELTQLAREARLRDLRRAASADTGLSRP